MDLAVHCMELIYSITGENITDVKAFYGTNTFNYEVEDSATIGFKTKGGILGHIDVNFNIPDSAATSRLELYGTAGSLIAEGTLGQEEVGKMKFIYAPQGDYEAAQVRSSSKPKLYYGKGGNIYTKQFKKFNQLLKRKNPDYSSAREAIKIQKLCDKIYGN